MKYSGTRHKARNRAVGLLFEAEAKEVSPQQLIIQRRELFVNDDSIGVVHDYTEKAVLGVYANNSQIDAVISSHLDKWQLDRLPAVDRAILRLATWELFNSYEVDTFVIVDEAIQLAKELSTDNSPSFVNGVLAKISESALQFRTAVCTGNDPTTNDG